MIFTCEDMSMCDSAHSVTGRQRQKLLLLTLPVLVSFTLEEPIGSSVHSAEDFCETGSMEILLRENTESIFQIVRLSAVDQLGSIVRLDFEACIVTADE